MGTYSMISGVFRVSSVQEREALDGRRFAILRASTYTKKDGKYVSYWYTFTLWGQRVEGFLRNVRPGMLVYIVGRPTFDDETGNPRVWVGQNSEARSSFDATILDWNIIDWASDEK